MCKQSQIACGGAGRHSCLNSIQVITWTSSRAASASMYGCCPMLDPCWLRQPTCQQEAGPDSDAQAGREHAIGELCATALLLLRQHQFVQMGVEVQAAWRGMMCSWVVAAAALLAAAMLAPSAARRRFVAAAGVMMHRPHAGVPSSTLFLLVADHRQPCNWSL
jgi:hypothetical protein